MDFGSQKHLYPSKYIPMTRSLAIIIVNWNSYDDTAACLSSLRQLTFAAYEIVVVDNASEDGSGQRLKDEFDEITLLVNSKNEGFTGGNNRGIQYALDAGFEYLMLLNNDTIVTPGFVQPLLQVLQAHDVGAVQPKILYESERNIIWNAGTGFNRWGFFPYTLGQGKADHAFGNHARRIPWITGCCFLVKAKIVREVGALDDQFFIYYEDTDWSLRIRKAGYHLQYEPASKIYHKVGRSHKNRSSEGEGNLSPFAHYITLRNHMYILRKHAKGIRFVTGWVYQCNKVSSYVLYFLFKARIKKMSAAAQGWLDGHKPMVDEEHKL